MKKIANVMNVNNITFMLAAFGGWREKNCGGGHLLDATKEGANFN